MTFIHRKLFFGFFRFIFWAAFCLALASFLLFCLLELFPGLTQYANLYRIKYYAIKGRFILDKELIFRNKSNLKIRIKGYKGDLYSPAYGADIAPHDYMAVFDKDGFRNTGADGSSDIVVLGDSYIEYGENNADTFSQRLSEATGLKVLNLGVGGYGPQQYVIALKRYGISRRPRYALFCFFEGNDIQDISSFEAWKRDGSYYYLDIVSKNFFQRYVIALWETIDFLKRYYIQPARQALFYTHETEKMFDPRWSELDLGGVVVKTVFCFLLDKREAKELLNTSAWLALRNILAEFKGLCLQNGVIPIVVFIPDKTHVYAEYSSESRGGREWLEHRIEQVAIKHNIENAMVEMCEGLKVKLINLAPLFETYARQEEFLYYPFDTHWNSRAREVCALFVAKELGLAQQNP